MKRDEKGKTRVYRKLNIDDDTKVSVRPRQGRSSGKREAARASSKKDSQGTVDIPPDEDFEFHPDFDDIDLLDTDGYGPDMGSGTYGDDGLGGERIEKRSRRRSVPDESKGSRRTSTRQKKRLNADGDVIDNLFDTPESELEDDDTYMDFSDAGKTKEERKAGRKRRRSQNREILAVTYVFAGLFVLIIGYFVYFNGFVAQDVISSPYNVRVNSFADTIVRGDIISSDGITLAETITDENGEETRYYPLGRIFAHAVGTSEINQSGLELSNNFYMLQSNSNPLYNVINDLRGIKNQGDQVITTLNASLQEAAYNALGNNDGAVVAIEPSTGRVLAMVSKPDYDPNTLVSDYESIISGEGEDVLLNKATSGRFVPGSIFKTFTSLAYIRSGADYDSYSYTCQGRINLGGDEYITCFDGNVHGDEDFYDSFAYSCNASFGNIGLGLSKSLFRDTCNSLFFNTDLPTSIPHVKSNFDLDDDASDWLTAATAIGQGETTVTPLHMAMIASAIANGGNLMEPYMTDAVQTSSGDNVRRFMPESYGSIMTTSEAELLTEMMTDVVDYGTATSLSGYGYTVAGKTGTAEVDGRGDNSWFIGFAPVEQPQIAICVLVENDEGYYESALPVANAVLSNYLNQ